MNFNRKYIKIDVDSNNPLAHKVPRAHISLVEYYVVNSSTGNQLNGRFNSSNDLGSNTLRNRIVNFMNNYNIIFESKSLVKMGTSDWLGTQMQMKRNGNEESFDFLTEYVVQEMWNILSQGGYVSSRSIKRINKGTFNWIRRINGVNNNVTNDTTWYLEEWKNSLGQPVMYIKIYTPAKPHISIASEDDFKMGVNPGGFSPGANASQITGGSYKDSYQSREISFIKLT